MAAAWTATVPWTPRQAQARPPGARGVRLSEPRSHGRARRDEGAQRRGHHSVASSLSPDPHMACVWQAGAHHSPEGQAPGRSLGRWLTYCARSEKA